MRNRRNEHKDMKRTCKAAYGQKPELRFEIRESGAVKWQVCDISAYVNVQGCDIITTRKSKKLVWAA